MRVYLFAGLGVFLLIAPWTPLWDKGTLVFATTPLGAWLESGWFRGAVSGLGVLDLLAALSDASALRRILRDSPGGET